MSDFLAVPGAVPASTGFTLKDLVSAMPDDGQAVDVTPVTPATIFGAEGQPPGIARKMAGLRRAQAQFNRQPYTSFEQQHADPIERGRVASLMRMYGDGLPDVAPEAREGAADLDMQKAATLFNQGAVKSSKLQQAWAKFQSRPTSLKDEEAQSILQIVKHVGDITDTVDKGDLSFDDKAHISTVDMTEQGPQVHISPKVGWDDPGQTITRALRTIPTRLPYTRPVEGVVVSQDGEVNVNAKVERTVAAKARHLRPTLQQQDVAMWAPGEARKVADLERMLALVDRQVDGHVVTRFSTTAFGGKHPAQLPGTTLMVDARDTATIRALSRVGDVVDPGEPMSVQRTDDQPDDEPDAPVTRRSDRSRQVAVRLKDDADLAAAIADVHAKGGKVHAVYTEQAAPKGWAQAREHLFTDSVTSALVRTAETEFTAPHGFDVLVPADEHAKLPTTMPLAGRRGPKANRVQREASMTYDIGGMAMADHDPMTSKGFNVTHESRLPYITKNDQDPDVSVVDGKFVVNARNPGDLSKDARTVDLLLALGVHPDRIRVSVGGKSLKPAV